MSWKVLRHPDKNKIIEKLTNGESVRELAAQLKKKYAGNKELQISAVTLQSFRKKYLKLDGKVLEDIQKVKKEKDQKVEAQKKIEQIKATNAYNEKINEIVDTQLDVARKILSLDKIIESRMEYWYNSIYDGSASAEKADKELRLFMDRQMNLLAQYKKFIEGMADKTVEHNVNVTVMNDQISVIQDVIRECVAELPPDTAVRFMETLSVKLDQVSYRPELPAPNKQNALVEADFTDIEDGILDD